MIYSNNWNHLTVWKRMSLDSLKKCYQQNMITNNIFYIYIYKEWVECSPVIQETGVQSQVESYQKLKKWYLMPPCLTLSTILWGSRVKWSNPGNAVVSSPTPRCSSYWKRRLRVTLDEGHQLYFYFIKRIWH